MKNIFKILAISLLALSISGCSKEMEAPELLKPVGVELDTATAEIAELTVKDSYQGSVVPYVEEITYESDVVISKSHVILGDEVKKGDVLIEFDTEAINEKIDELEDEIDYNKTKNSYENSALELEVKIANLEYEKLLNQQSIWVEYYQAVEEREEKLEELSSQTPQPTATATPTLEPTLTPEPTGTEEPISIQEVTATPTPTPTATPTPTLPPIEEPTVSNPTEGELVLAKSAVETANLNLSQAKQTQALNLSQQQASLASLKDTLTNNTLVAPIDGAVVYYQNLKEGDTVFAYDPIIAIADDTKLSVSCSFIADTKAIGQSVEIIASINGAKYPIEYVEMDSSEYMTLLLSGKSISTDFNFLEIDKYVKAGNFASVELYKTIIEDALVIPSNAIYGNRTTGYYVYLVLNEELIKTEVAIGAENDTFVQILSGIKEDDVVYVQN